MKRLEWSQDELHCPYSLCSFWSRDQLWISRWLMSPFTTAFMGTLLPLLPSSVNLFKIFFACRYSTWSFNCFSCFDPDDMEVVENEESFGDFGYLGFDGLSRGWILGTRHKTHLWGMSSGCSWWRSLKLNQVNEDHTVVPHQIVKLFALRIKSSYHHQAWTLLPK